MQTIPNYANHTLDELKAIVYQHMRKQGTYAHDEGTCWYLINGNKCGLGLFIPDSLYDPDMESEGGWWQNPLREALKKLGLTSPEKMKFLRDMQNLHDRHANRGKSFHQYLESLERFPTSPD